MVEYLGEIIETNSLGFVAESKELHQSPPLGALVKTLREGRDDCYAIVTFGTTHGIDSTRRPVRRADATTRDEAVYASHPQLKRLLHTEFHAAFVGWNDNGSIRQTLPPMPPPLHHSVYPCEPEKVLAFTQRFDYLRLLIRLESQTPADQVLAAHIRHVYTLRGNDDAWLEEAARAIAALLKSDHDQLLAVLYAIDPER
ncbi:hypothetical protein [Ardenticatena maritima]|uniref:Helicase HerA barrel domain-containing protein n=1 Tax=Ardenticatena maritima TaxID=872965 RepID=A0A0N8GSJ6_9CHLR|nr:hypothetical protein [Ardenticatena maritima]KPL89482.1 hypothetical protein SE16_03340 [Ardenticatena maritima]